MTPLWYILITVSHLLILVSGYLLALLTPYITKRLAQRFAKPVQPSTKPTTI